MLDEQFYFLSYNSDNHPGQIQELVAWLNECNADHDSLVHIDISISNRAEEDYTSVTEQIDRANLFICLLDDPEQHQLQELSYADRQAKPIIIIQP